MLKYKINCKQLTYSLILSRDFTLYQLSTRYKRGVYLDDETAFAILDFLKNKNYKKKFDYLVGRILEQDNRFYDDYCIIKNYKGLTEFRLFPNGINARIYCKEVFNANLEICIVAILVIPKKADVNKSITQQWDAILKYEYTC